MKLKLLFGCFWLAQLQAAALSRRGDKIFLTLICQKVTTMAGVPIDREFVEKLVLSIKKIKFADSKEQAVKITLAEINALCMFFAADSPLYDKIAAESSGKSKHEIAKISFSVINAELLREFQKMAALHTPQQRIASIKQYLDSNKPKWAFWIAATGLACAVAALLVFVALAPKRSFVAV